MLALAMSELRGLYAIVDPEHCGGRAPLEVAQQILAGGCCALQLRAKRLSDAELLKLAVAMRALCRPATVPFWLNDRLDIALLAEADGLHLGQDDLPAAEARRLWGSRPLGVSTHSLAQVDAALAQGADVIGFGPVFATTSKTRPDPQVGVDALRAVCSRSEVPVIAIGGITLQQVPQLRAAGAKVCAVIRQVAGADDPRAAAHAFHSALL
jgi:thiamine-phosphate diphosphorylase